tara:strand:+ start:6537 stop:6650 length:114 start_codon:yes stop_codon:yes gene_type:complete
MKKSKWKKEAENKLKEYLKKNIQMYTNTEQQQNKKNE